MLSGMKKNPAAVSLGRRGGRARAKALTAAERRAIATNAARIWEIYEPLLQASEGARA